MSASISSTIPLQPLQNPSSPDRSSPHNTTDNENDNNIQNTTQSLNEFAPITKSRQTLVLVSAFLTIAVTIGFNQSFGVFLSYYISPSQSMLPESTSTQSAFVAFVGTLGYGLTWGGSIIINPIISRLEMKGTRTLCTIGVILMSLGFTLASFATQIWHLLLTQGLMYGLGASMLYFPILSSAPEYFTTHRGTAMGIILSGAGIGGLVLSPVIRALLTAIGPRWTLRFLAGLNLVVSLPIAISAAPSRFQGRRPTHIDLKLALKPAFLFSVGGAFLASGGNGLPTTFLPQYSVAVGFDPAFGATLLALSNGVNSLSRIATGWIGDKWGRQNTLIATVILSVVSVLGFWAGSVAQGGNKPLWVLFVIIYGIAGGGYNSLFPTTISSVFGLQAYASVVGFLYFVRGLGVTFGAPVGGKILGEMSSTVMSYKGVVWFDAALLAGAAVCVVGVRIWDAREKGDWVWRA